MNALRLTFEKPPREVRIPDEFMAHPLEIIIMSMGDTSEFTKPQNGPSKLRDFAGRWLGNCIVRESEGNFEVRQDFK